MFLFLCILWLRNPSTFLSPIGDPTNRYRILRFCADPATCPENKMPVLAITNFNVVCSILGGFITLFGLVSYLFKERFYLSEALISLLAGVTFSPNVTNLIRPLEYAGSEANLNAITLSFSRLVLGVQLVLAGVQLPSRYLQKEWRSLAVLLGPAMTAMWLISSLIMWTVVPDLPFLHALAVAACITPTDPILSNTIVRGKFADRHVPKPLQNIIIAESGANDGLGYPFLFLALYLIKYNNQADGATTILTLWFGETWGYTILLSAVYGAAVGWLAKGLLHWAEEKRFVDRESFLVFAIALALFTVGTCGIVGSDDVLACFVVGNTFTWDDWFRLETLDDSLQPTIDMLLNLSIFIWFGAVCPWDSFATNSVVSMYRLVLLGVLILLLRRLPILFVLRKYIHQIDGRRQAVFMGFFGPIGVSAIFYLYITLEFLDTIKVDGVQRDDARKLGEVVTVVIWFLAICSNVVHGLSIPVGMVGLYLPRTLSQAVEATTNNERFGPISAPVQVIFGRRRRKDLAGDTSDSPDPSPSPSSPLLSRIGGSIIRDRNFGSITLIGAGPSTLPELSYSRIISFPDEN